MPDVNGMPSLHECGWKNASTFEAFCDRHDAMTFAPLETVLFQGTKEQIFLIAYRAICWELYRKIAAVKSGAVARDLVDRGLPQNLQRGIQVLRSVQDAGFRKGLASLETVKRELDLAYQSKAYSKFATYEIKLDGPLSIAATGAISPNR